jgi:hypothetical protein
MKLNTILNFIQDFRLETSFAKPFILGFYQEVFIHVFKEGYWPHQQINAHDKNWGIFSSYMYMWGIVKEPGAK